MNYLTGEQMTPAGRLLQSPGLAMAGAAAQNLTAGMRGQAPAASPVQAYQQAIANRAAMAQQQQQMENLMLRRQQLEQQMNPFFAYETALEKGYVPRGTSLADFQQMQYRSSTSRPSSLLEWDAYNAMTDEERGQYMNLQRGPTTVKYGDATLMLDPADPNKAQVIGPNGVETVDDVSAWVRDQSAQKTRAMTLAEQVAERDANFEVVAGEQLPALEGALEDTRALLNDIQSGKFQNTGFFEGRYMRFTDEDTARLAAKQVMQTLKNLQITNLAPVTEAEIRLIEDLYASVLKDPAANIGALTEAISMLEGKINTIDRMGRYYVNNGGTLKGYNVFDRWQPQTITVPDLPED